eukprot:scaffold8421_cov114-Isochrysis_galbana.AAC.3
MASPMSTSVGAASAPREACGSWWRVTSTLARARRRASRSRAPPLARAPAGRRTPRRRGGKSRPRPSRRRPRPRGLAPPVCKRARRGQPGCLLGLQRSRGMRWAAGCIPTSCLVSYVHSDECLDHRPFHKATPFGLRSLTSSVASGPTVATAITLYACGHCRPLAFISACSASSPAPANVEAPIGYSDCRNE